MDRFLKRCRFSFLHFVHLFHKKTYRFISNFINLLPDGTHIWLNAGSVLRDYGDLTGRRRVVELDGATASTALRFTSEPASGEFSRWFIDDICVTK